MVYSLLKVIPQNFIVHRPYVLRAIFASLVRSRARAYTTKKDMVAFAKRLGLRESEYRDPMILLFSSTAAIAFFLYSEYKAIFISELKAVTENESIASVKKTLFINN